jgi:hypothetical protein
MEITGGNTFGDSRYNDKFVWAVCELFTTTKKSIFTKQVDHYCASTPMNTVADWQNTATLGWITLASNFSDNAYSR